VLRKNSGSTFSSRLSTLTFLTNIYIFWGGKKEMSFKKTNPYRTLTGLGGEFTAQPHGRCGILG
jgi:hypothetical protein